jgi:hypothetical protein
MAEIGVVHLVRAQNGLPPFRRFLKSYAKYRPAVKHELLIIYKGFNSQDEAREYRDCLQSFDHRDFFVSDLGYDLRAYALAVRHFHNPCLCFLNSFSVLLDEGWLDKMVALATRPGIGLVGATGSWESMYSNLLSATGTERAQGGVSPKFLPHFLRRQINRFFFYPFPNHHIRTNAFMLSREIMLKVWPINILTKKSSYLFENGKQNLTQRVLKLGLKVMVAGKDGQGYEMQDWARSNTFRQARQENLLVADNQTRQYADTDSTTRKYLSQLTWGDQANWGA